MSQERRTWVWVTLLLAAGALLRIVFIRIHPVFDGDPLVYGELATNMLIHHVYGFTRGAIVVPSLIRLPGYPIFLAACFKLFGIGNFATVLWVQLLVSLADCCLLAALAVRLWGRQAALATLALATLCPFTANYCAIPLTETLCLFAVSLALYGFERWAAACSPLKVINPWLIPVVFALILSIFLRPDQALLAVVIVAAMLWVNFRPGLEGFFTRIAPAVTVAVAIAFPLLLWGARNWHDFHVIQPLAPRFANDPGQANPYGFQRWYRTWAIDYKASADFYWPYDGSPIRFQDLPPRAIDNPLQRDETQRLFAAYNQEDASSPTFDAAFMQLANERIAARPLRYYVEIPLLKVLDMWLRPRTEFLFMPMDWWNFRAHRRQSWESLGYALLNASYLVLAAIGLAKWHRQRWNGHQALAWACIAFIMLRCALLWTVDNSEPRYTLEFFPIIFLLAGFAVTRRESASA